LLLGGTSFPLSARKELIAFLLEKGFEVASIENPLGGPFDVRIDPVRERPESLREFLDHLKRQEKVEGIDIVAQSYSAFEVIRVLAADPTFHPLIKSILFINPPGFDPRNNLVRHSLRFLWGHLLKGYLVNFSRLLGASLTPISGDPRKKKQFIQREIRGINFLALETSRNIVRTLRELKDIVTFRAKESLRTLQEHGLPIYFFLQTEDQMIRARITREEVRDLVPERNVKMVPGGHVDLFIQEWQREALFDFLQEIRSGGKEGG
jgi:hypothetical protein